MPINTLQFASQVASEMIELRQSEELSDIESALEVEERYIALIDRLSDDEYMLGAIPSLIEQVKNQDLVLNDGLMAEVFFHLVCRTLQFDWISMLFNLVESGKYSRDALHLIFYLPLEYLESVLKVAMKHGWRMKLWVVGWCVRNNRVDFIDVSGLPTNDDELQYVAQLFVQKNHKAESGCLEEKMSTENSMIAKMILSLGLSSADRGKSISYLKNKAWLTDLSVNSSDWLAFSGGKSELRYIESIVEDLLSEYDLDSTEDDLRIIIKLTNALVCWGDLHVVQWIYKIFISHSQPRIRDVGLTAMSQFFSEDARYETQRWLSSCKKDKDALGDFSLFSALEAKSFLHELEVRSSRPLSSEVVQYQADMLAKKTNKIRVMLDDVGYADTLLANKVRLYLYLLNGKFYALDELGRYSLFIKQKEEIKACF